MAFFGCLDALNPSCPINQTAAQGIFTGKGGPLTTIADTSGPYSHFGNPSINNAGTVVFMALLEAGGSGIFTGPDPVADKVIATGEILFGSTVASLGFLQGLGLNDAGQVAFWAMLADGRQVIARADPVPEPPDRDGDSIPDDEDACPGTGIPEAVPTVQLGVNRFALTNADGIFDTVAPTGKGPQKTFTIADTAGCSCEQIIAMLSLGKGHTKFGCSIDAMKRWIEMVNP